MDECVLKIEQLEKSFGDLHVLKGIDLEIHKGEVVCIIGASGSGKSTLLRCINLLEEADDGHIWFDGQDLMDLNVNLNALRQKIGMVFQSFNLFNNKNVIPPGSPAARSSVSPSRERSAWSPKSCSLTSLPPRWTLRSSAKCWMS